MGCKVLWLNVALLSFLMICEHVRAQCTPPSFPSRNVVMSESSLSAQSFPDGSTVTFECDTGYKSVNSRASKYVTCEGNQWTSLELECTKKTCGSPPDIINGRYEIEGILFGDKITAVCDTGYMLDGQIKYRWCREGGWDGRHPVCEVVKCNAPPAIVNGQLGDQPWDSYEYLQVVTYKCNSGFSLIGSSALHCSEDGTFKPDPPKCLDGCPKPEIPHAYRIGGKPPPYKLSNLIDYKCDTGYTMKGESHIVCTENGWNPKPPECIVVKCKAPTPIVNGQHGEELRDSYDYLQVLSYKCNSGFNLIGSSTLRCSEDGTFKPDPPKCVAPSTTSTSTTSTSTTSTSTTTTTSTVVTSKARPNTDATDAIDDKDDTDRTSSSNVPRTLGIVFGVLIAFGLAIGGAFAYKKYRSKHEKVPTREREGVGEGEL